MVAAIGIPQQRLVSKAVLSVETPDGRYFRSIGVADAGTVAPRSDS